MTTRVTRAQELLGNTKCDLCDTYKNVSWKCQNCNETLCEQCKKSHLRSKLSRNHIISELKDYSRSNHGSSVFCSDHENEAFQMFCSSCDILVCLDCIRGKHKDHECKKIKEVVQSKQTQLEDTFKQIKSQQLPKLERSLVAINKLEENYSQDVDRVIMEIKNKGEELKQEITKIQNRFIDELMQQTTADQKSLGETKEQLDLRLSVLKEQLKHQEVMITKLTDIDIIAKAVSIKESLSQLTTSPEIPTVNLSKFQTGQVNKNVLESMYGQLVLQQGNYQTLRPKSSREQTVDLPVETLKQEISKPREIKVIKGNIVSSFTWRKKLDKITMTNQNEAWVMTNSDSNKGQYLELVNNKGKNITSIRPDFVIYDMATTISGDLLVTMGVGYHIMRLSRSGSTDIFADASPYTPRGIHIMGNGDVLVGLCGNWNLNSRVTRLSPQGQTLQEIDKINEDLNLGIPFRITENVNRDIVMLCDGSSVLVVDKDGRYRFSYTGPPTWITMAKRFNPTDIVCHQSGQILVADIQNSAIHLLDKDGTFIQFILTKQHGLKDTKALAIDHDSKIWIGCFKGKVFIAE